jgi:methionyl-tRNA formyltransferase
MRIDLLCTNPDHPVVPSLRRWIEHHNTAHDLRLIHDKSDLTEGDILYLVSCSQLIGTSERARYGHVLVLHASDLPEGRGWSPHIWDILNGKETLTLSLLTAEDGVDTGDIWAKKRFDVPRHALYDEINALLFQAELDLMDCGIAMVAGGEAPVPQPTEGGSYHPRRTPEDSRLDPAQPLSALFDQLRVADPDRFPAFFELHGQTYNLILKKRET